MPPRVSRATLLSVLWIGTGCTGLIDDPREGSAADPSTPNESSSPLDLHEACVDGTTPVAAPLRRLTRTELESTLRDLVGDEVFAEIEVDFGAFPGDDVGPGSVGSFSPLHTATHVEAVIATADAAAAALATQRTELERRGWGCIVGSAPDEACVRSFVAGFGLRVYRRPLTDAEVSDHVAFHAAAPDPAEGFHRLVMRFFASPELLFHVEGDGELEGEMLALDGYEVANRISYMALGTMPTDALFAAAAAGELRTLAQVEEQVRALMEEPRARAHVDRFFAHWLERDERPGIPDDPSMLDGLAPEGLREAMLDELDLYVSTLFWEQNADYRTLMSSPLAFPTDPRVAAIYEVPIHREGAAPPTTDSRRGGLPLRAALLLSETIPTAPILRGVFLRRQILCDELPSPDADIVSARLQDLDGLDPVEMSSRQQIEIITAEEPCASCHTHINPLAFALEQFDRLGRFRATERVYRDGELVAEHPIDSSVEPDIEDDGPAHVDGAAELVAAIANSDKGHACFAQRLFEHTRVRLPAEGDACQLRDVYTRLRDGGSLLDAYVATIVQDVILTRRVEETP